MRKRRGTTHLLVETAAETPVEEAAGLGPDGAVGAALGLHAADAVVQVDVVVGDLEERRVQGRLAGLELLGRLGAVLGRALRVVGLGLEAGVRLVEALHVGEDLVAAVLDLGDALGLHDAAARLLVGVHLHLSVVDGGVEDDPGTTALRGKGRGKVGQRSARQKKSAGRPRLTSSPLGTM